MIDLLIIGTNGQVGSALKQLAPKKYKIATTTRNGTPEDYSLDLSIRDQISDLLKKLKPRVIINAAAYTAVDRAEEEKENAYMINADAVQTLAEVSSEIGSIFVHYSTDYVFDGDTRTCWEETDPTSPVNSYGSSKLAGETKIKASGCKYLVLRTSWVYSHTGNNFVKTMLRLGLERDELRIVADQTGRPTSAKEIAQVTYRIIETCLTNPKVLNQVYHLASNVEKSWFDFGKDIFHEAQKYNSKYAKIKVEAIGSEQYPTPARRPKYSTLSTKKIESVLKSNFEIDYEGHLSECILKIVSTDHKTPS
ncbi:MAG: dTDP-4-dehydrorhamnose reductase [Pseudobacteriovorax sp.]|nr:dTDP-4-dehydrorhamnose reductase [Pseudobacteriovorax sp.]